MASGTARARNVTVDSLSATAFRSGQADLERWALESDWSLKVDAGENAVTGAEPQVGVLFRGPLDAPHREIDIQPFTAFLTLRAFEKEVRRVEDLQADVNERERLMREQRQLNRNKAKRERAAEEKAEREQAAKEEAARKVEEEAAQRAKAQQEKAAQEKAAREKKAAQEKAAQEKAACDAAKAAKEPQTSDTGDIGRPMSMYEFIKRIRPAIDGADDPRSGTGKPKSGLTPVPATGEPLKLNGGLGAPISIDKLRGNARC
ncbi:hypothetical protein [Breoghania sp.]|uniref:hypothetical protein n=1 Tax=Breoghania sp. TaxID=2065378 RepID=UPI00261BD9C6|nr:hypothetical protein [Breoghania sp.]MDJ0931181.1 hypothetical protein [Breoghania sp.]